MSEHTNSRISCDNYITELNEFLLVNWLRLKPA